MDRKRDRGSMTVEAAIFLVIFLMGFLTIINFARLARAEVMVQHAINHAAMQISQYSYILTKTGVTAELEDTAERAKEIESDANTVISKVKELSSALDGVSDGNLEVGDISAIFDAVSGSGEAINIVTGYFKTPGGLFTGLLALAQANIEQQASTLVVSRIAQSQVEAYFENITDNPDAYLKGIGIEGGLEGLDFRESRYVTGGNRDIQITVRFKVKNQMFQAFDFGEHVMQLNASTRIW